MKISDILRQRERTLSFEVFPPKSWSGMDAVLAAAEGIGALRPDFMSVTYGAGGGTSDFTTNIAADLQNKLGVTVVPHLTCVSSSRERVRSMITQYREQGLQNIMALRGDIPPDGLPQKQDYAYAVELVRDIREQGDFCLGAACYPEGHPEAPSRDDDLRRLVEKVHAGVDFITTQMFFDNSIFYHFLYRLRETGINVPVLAGIMPVTNKRMYKRSIELTGTIVPERFKAMVDRFGDDPASMTQAGIIYASEQIIDLFAHGIRNVHVYSMNKPEVAAGIMNNVRAFLGQAQAAS